MLFLEHDLVDEGRELLGKKREQPHDGAVFVLRDNRRRLPRFADAAGKRHAAFRELGGGARLVGLEGRAAQNLADAQVSNHLLSERHRHRRFRQAEWTCHGMRKGAGVLNHLLMRLQTNGQRRGPLREQSTKSIFVFLAVMSQLPVLHGPQG